MAPARGDEERRCTKAKAVDDGGYLVLRIGCVCLAHRPELSERGGIAAFAVATSSCGESFKDDFGDLLRCARQQLLGMLIDRIVEAADRNVVQKFDVPVPLGVRMTPVIPSPHQGVLQHGKLIGFVAGVVKETLHQGRCDCHPTQRTLDGLLPLFARHARDEVLTVVERFRKVAELGAIAEVVGPHRQDDIDRRLVTTCGEQELDEFCGFTRREVPPPPRVFRQRLRILVAKQFLELIDNDQEAFVRWELLRDVD